MAFSFSRLLFTAKAVSNVSHGQVQGYLHKYTPKHIETYKSLCTSWGLVNASPELIQRSFVFSSVGNKKKDTPDNTRLSILGTTVLDFAVGQALKTGDDSLSKDQISTLGMFIGGDYYLYKLFKHMNMADYLPVEEQDLSQIEPSQASSVVRSIIGSIYESKPEDAIQFVNKLLLDPAFLYSQILTESVRQDDSSATAGLSRNTIDTLIKYLHPSTTLGLIVKSRKMHVLYAKYNIITNESTGLVHYHAVLYSGNKEIGSASGPSPREAITLAARSIIFSSEYVSDLNFISAPDTTYELDKDHIPILEEE